MSELIRVGFGLLAQHHHRIRPSIRQSVSISIRIDQPVTDSVVLLIDRPVGQPESNSFSSGLPTLDNMEPQCPFWLSGCLSLPLLSQGFYRQPFSSPKCPS